jgi:hypothetical protein
MPGAGPAVGGEPAKAGLVVEPATGFNPWWFNPWRFSTRGCARNPVAFLRFGRVAPAGGRAESRIKQEGHMARYDGGDYGYDRAEYGRSGMRRELSLSPRYPGGQSADPNYRNGEYGGMRMQPGTPGQSSYGWYRATHARDLGNAGGFEGRYGPAWGQGRGGWTPDGQYRDQFDRAQEQAWRQNRDVAMQQGRPMQRGYPGGPQQGWPRYDHEHRGPQDGGVRRDLRHLRQLNANSVTFRHGSEHDRSFGYAEHPDQGGGAGRGRPGENAYGGRNAGGFSEMHRPRQAFR